MKQVIVGLILLLIAFVGFPVMIIADDKTGETIDWQVISGGGSMNGASSSYKLSGTLAQTAVGTGSSTNYGINHGFWQNFVTGGPGCCTMPGDANDNDAINILDVTFIISYLYRGGAAPPCIDQADANGNNALNILDVTYIITYLYRGGSAPICGTTGT